ncbi:MAG TPA: hypothetical protein DCR20_08265 [Planctomycetaceae bacterium]|nr:hypothetical protein [Planctomycetaceae bacterium]
MFPERRFSQAVSKAGSLFVEAGVLSSAAVCFCSDLPRLRLSTSGKKQMLSRRISLSAALGFLLCGLHSTPVNAQLFGNPCACGPAQNAWAVQSAAATCYQTVPVTTYVQEKQTVDVATWQTVMENREVTTYRPETVSRTVEVPTVSYQNVVEHQTVNRDMGRWITRYHPVSRYSPCQIDPRPGVVGWLNRTGYSMRTAFMPSYTTSREYVPNVMAFSVPVTRQVAVRSTQRMTYQETRLVRKVEMEKVPVQKLVYKPEQRTVMRPETTWRTVPIGTAMAMSPWGGVQTVYGVPVQTRTAAGPRPDPNFDRSAADDRAADPADGQQPFRRSSDEDDSVQRSSFRRSADEESEPSFNLPQTRREQPVQIRATGSVAGSASGWRASRRPSDSTLTASAAPILTVSESDDEH